MDAAFGCIRPFIHIFISLFLVLSVGLSHAQAAPDTGFLDNSANTDGSISLKDDVGLPYQSTAESVITYETLRKPDVATVVNDRAYLKSAAVSSTENLALRLLTLPVNDPDFNALFTDITNRQNLDDFFFFDLVFYFILY